MAKRASKSSQQNSPEGALALLQSLLGEKPIRREGTSKRQSITGRDRVLRLLLKKSTDGNTQAYKLLQRHLAEFPTAYSRWAKTRQRSQGDDWSSIAPGGVLVVPFGWAIDKITAHADTLNADDRLKFFAELVGLGRGSEWSGKVIPPPPQFAP